MKKQKKIFQITNKKHTSVCFLNSLKYITDLYDIELSFGDDIYTYNGTANSLVNYLCSSELKDYSTVIKISKKFFNLTTKIPVYIRHDLILLLTGSLRNYETEIFNYSMIDNIYDEDGKTLIIFKDGTKYVAKTSYYSLKKLIDTCKKIEEYFKNRT